MLAAAAQSLPGEELLAIEYLDARGSDGQARKYRVMMIGGRLYPLHLAISKNWKVHYFTADMAEHADYRGRRGQIPGRHAVRARRQGDPRRYKEIQSRRSASTMPASISGRRNGDLLLFETNATMVIAEPDADERWAYRRTAITGIIDAVVAMILQKSTAARPRRR